jgi:hypothetical protein
MRIVPLTLVVAWTSLLVACAAEEEDGFGGGGAPAATDGESGVEGDEGETGDRAPVINNVAAGFEDFGQWVIEFGVDYTYEGDLTDGGEVQLRLEDEGGSVLLNQPLEVGGQYAPLDDGIIIFAVEDGVSPAVSYRYDITLRSPAGAESQPVDGWVEAIRD